MRMRHTIRERWIEALRSGRYRQAYGRLARRYQSQLKVCALGVLCELAVEEGVTTRTTSDNHGVTYGNTHENSVLPPEVAVWAGLRDCRPMVRHPDDGLVFASIDSLNDDGKLPFDEIAKLIDGDPDRTGDADQ